MEKMTWMKVCRGITKANKNAERTQEGESVEKVTKSEEEELGQKGRKFKMGLTAFPKGRQAMSKNSSGQQVYDG
jgi:hypothetical protein